jgi:hypothetical protein
MPLAITLQLSLQTIKLLHGSSKFARVLQRSHKVIPKLKKGDDPNFAALNSPLTPPTKSNFRRAAKHDPAARPQTFCCVAAADDRMKVCKSYKHC